MWGLCFGRAGLAGGHPLEEALQAPPQHRVLGRLPQAAVELLHLLVLTFDICRKAEGVTGGLSHSQKKHDCSLKKKPGDWQMVK